MSEYVRERGAAGERARIAEEIRKRAAKFWAIGWRHEAAALDRLADDIEGKNGRSLESEP